MLDILEHSVLLILLLHDVSGCVLHCCAPLLFFYSVVRCRASPLFFLYRYFVLVKLNRTFLILSICKFAFINIKTPTSYPMSNNPTTQHGGSESVYPRHLSIFFVVFCKKISVEKITAVDA